MGELFTGIKMVCIWVYVLLCGVSGGGNRSIDTIHSPKFAEL